jgi:hypothetical protein
MFDNRHVARRNNDQIRGLTIYTQVPSFLICVTIVGKKIVVRSMVKNRSGGAWALLVSALHVVWLMWNRASNCAHSQERGIISGREKNEKRGRCW